MKNKYSIVIYCSFLCALSLFSCTNNSTLTKEWCLVWEEDFSTPEMLSDIWSKVPRGLSDWNNYMSAQDTLYSIKDGTLTLKGVLNNFVPMDTATYLTGGLWSKGKKLFHGGRLEIEAQFGENIGCWPAIWLLPENSQWPEGGEIDIMEHLNFDDFVYQTVHSTFTKEYEGTNDNVQNNSSTGIIKPNEFNLYAVEMYEDSLVFFVNQQKTFTYKREPDYGELQFPFNRPYFIILSMQLGGEWVGRVDSTTLPVELNIKSIKHYQLK